MESQRGQKVSRPQKGQRSGKDGKWPMDGGARFAVGLLILWLGLLAFFFALHPNGVDLTGYSESPSGALQWLIHEFQSLGSGGTTSADTTATPNNAGAAPTETGA